MLNEIANSEEPVRSLEASTDPELQNFKNYLLRDNLNTALENNRELQIDARALNAREANLRVEIRDLGTKLDSLEKINAALPKDLDQVRPDSRANHTDSEVYLKALQKMTAISTMAITAEAQVIIAPRDSSEAGSLKMC